MRYANPKKRLMHNLKSGLNSGFCRLYYEFTHYYNPLRTKDCRYTPCMRSYLHVTSHGKCFAGAHLPVGYNCAIVPIQGTFHNLFGTQIKYSLLIRCLQERHSCLALLSLNLCIILGHEHLSRRLSFALVLIWVHVCVCVWETLRNQHFYTLWVEHQLCPPLAFYAESKP